MKLIFAIFLLLLSIFSNVLARPSSPIQTFDEFKAVYNKTYATDEQEEIARENFLESLKYVQTTNNPGVSINHLSDLSLEEFENQFLMNKKTFENLKKISGNFKATNFCQIDPNINIPWEIDLRSMHTITPIRIQGNCASSWAFATIASVESTYLAYKNLLLNLSEQELIDCASKHGCTGDTIDQGLYYIQRNGILSEHRYPYVAREQSCQRPSLNSRGYSIQNYCQIEPENPLKIRQLLKKTRSAIIALIGFHDLQAFRHYDGRTIIQHNDDNGEPVKYHAINIVGYSNTKGVDYWIIRNNWDTTWGDKGYGYLAANKNLMQIEQYPFVVIL
uniref:Peptidase 1-like n=1 Tax=Dermatophagoides pteronyssinus TaxID=6956 RepID=A0A6P6YJW8_DERPT|nr:peptidase 1-like [Dermatophagoides pteronyssinus]